VTFLYVYLKFITGDFVGGSRGFTIFDTTNGAVVYTSGNLLEHLSVRFGHYPEDRSRNKGSEPENIAMGTFKGFKRLFVNTERASLVFIFDVEDVANPKFIQALPTGSGPEGGLTIPSRGLYVVASEVDDRAAKIRSSITIFEDGYTHVNYPTIISANRADNTPIHFSALSGLAAEIRGNGNDVSNIMYSVEDSYFKKSRLFYIDISSFPAVITKEYRLLDTNKLLIVAPLGAKLVNSDLTVNLDLEGIAVSRLGGFWVVSEGAGTAGDPTRPITSNNYLIKVSNEGEIQKVVTLPKEVNDIQSRFGFEGCAEGSGSFANKVVVTFQRAWVGETSPRLGVYDFILNSWTFYFYPLEKVQSQFGGWVGLSDIAPLEGGKFLVVERDDQGGPDGVIKSLYMIDLEGAVIGTTISKTFVRDLKNDILSKGGLLLEKIEGVAVTRSGKVWIVNDNDGVEGNSGEIQLLEVSEMKYRPRLEGSPPGYENVMIVHINDHHSNFDEQVIDLPKSLIPPNLSTNTSSLRVLYGGFDRSVTLMNSMTSEANSKGHDVIKVHAGDALTGTLYFTYFGPEADAAVMNIAKFDAMTLGNHEFDEGDATLAGFVKKLQGTTILSANRKLVLYVLTRFYHYVSNNSSQNQ
jgi:Esterase-like activity of phytase